MKKIFAILSVVVLIFSMGVIGFATEKEKESYTVKVDLLEEPKIETINKETDEKNTNLKLGFTFINNTDIKLPAKDIGIKLVAKSTETMKELKITEFKFTDEKKYKTYELNLEEEKTFTAECKVATKNAIWLMVYIGDDTVDTIVIKDNNNIIKSVDEVPIEFTVYPNTIETTTTTTTTKAIESKPTETSTTVTETSTTVTETSTTVTETSTTVTETSTTVTETSTDDYYEYAPIEDEIPATGSNGVALTVFGALGITAVTAAMVIKKKKH